ncbi:serine hydrolase domain-containing protein [Robiginitalea sp. IMCC44478]|uniref:serine hydrolase domain-containing protein n=1 Tax=Robiginitalea sp. IMCC44478 TaxID=3459122 RepID=UPI004041CEFC
MRRIYLGRVGLTLFGLMLLGSCSNNKQAEINQKKEMALNGLIQQDSIKLSVEEVMKNKGLTGLSVAVFEDYEIIWQEAWGVKDANIEDSVDVETAFSTASISKGVTATLLAILEAKGLIDLKAPVSRYLKRWQIPSNDFTKDTPITMEHLLSHTAGTTQQGFADFYEGDTIPTLTESLQGKLPRYDEEISVVFKPGSNWQYSGGGYVIAQMALEDHMGRQLADLADEYLFTPLGMKHSTMKQPNEEGFLQNVAKAHDENGNVIRTGIPITPQVAPSGLWSTPHDMALFMIEMQKALAERDTEVISPQVARRVTKIVTTKTIGGWSLGWERMQGFGNREWFSHGGANTGTGGYVYGTMEGGNGIAFFGNGPNNVRMPLLDQFRNSIIKSHGWYKPLEIEEQKPIPESVLQEVTGRYKHVQYDAEIQVSEENGKLIINPFFGGIPAELHYLGETKFAVEEFPSNLVFEENPEDNKYYIALERRGFQGGLDFSFIKFQ